MSDEAQSDHPRGGVMYQPTEEQRRMVKVMSGFGIPQTDIASQVGIDTKTLRKHFREELDRGMTEANMRVAQSLFSMATTGGSVAAAIFWMKARAGWREKHPEEQTEDEKTTVVIHRFVVPYDTAKPPTTIAHDADSQCSPSRGPCSTPTNDR